MSSRWHTDRFCWSSSNCPSFLLPAVAGYCTRTQLYTFLALSKTILFSLTQTSHSQLHTLRNYVMKRSTHINYRTCIIIKRFSVNLHRITSLLYKFLIVCNMLNGFLITFPKTCSTRSSLKGNRKTYCGIITCGSQLLQFSLKVVRINCKQDGETRSWRATTERLLFHSYEHSGEKHTDVYHLP